MPARTWSQQERGATNVVGETSPLSAEVRERLILILSGTDHRGSHHRLHCIHQDGVAIVCADTPQVHLSDCGRALQSEKLTAALCACT
jgi:hypothetical protein